MAPTMTTTPAGSETKLTRKDFASDQENRWCPGCGDFSVLASMQRTLAEAGIPKEKLVFVSGIGCSSRFPYYMDCFGFHTIHGRGAAIATGIKCANPDLSVWVITGDGDGLSIGGNHLLHLLRRNLDIKVVLFNNRIYGLTKGQTSPTSPIGKVTRSTPMGSIEQPIHPISFAIAAEATFVARTIDTDPKHMQEIFQRAAHHKGTAFIEVLQNCVIFNDAVWANLSDKSTRDDTVVRLNHGQPIVYGKNRDKGIRLNGFKIEAVSLGNGVSESDLLVHDEQCDGALAYILSRTEDLDVPTPVGVFRAVNKPTYDGMLEAQVEGAKKQKGKALLKKLLHSGQCWTVTGNGNGNGSQG